MTRVGLADTLAYRITAPNVAQRGVRRAASTRVGSRLLARHLPAMDRTVARLSRGRTTAIELLAGLPIIELTTTGRRAGAGDGRDDLRRLPEVPDPHLRADGADLRPRALWMTGRRCR